MYWILLALLQPMFHGIANIIDSALANRKLPNIWTLIFYASLFNLIFLPIIFLLDPPQTPSSLQWGLLALLGLTNFSYLFPYYRALQIADTSVVVSLFSLGRIFIPLFAYLVVGEQLSINQYTGFGLIVFAGAFLTFELKKFRFSASLPLMLISSLIVTLEALVFKYLFITGLNWGAAFGFQSLFAFLWVLPLLLLSNQRHAIREGWKSFRQSKHLFFIEETVTSIGSGVSVFVISLVPLTFEKTVESFQPMFVLLYALVFARRWPNLFKEQIHGGTFAKKIFLFLLMLAGVVLMSI